jgi:hypothetical protein
VRLMPPKLALLVEKNAPADRSAGARRLSDYDLPSYLMALMNALPFGTPRPVTESQPAPVLMLSAE